MRKPERSEHQKYLCVANSTAIIYVAVVVCCVGSGKGSEDQLIQAARQSDLKTIRLLCKQKGINLDRTNAYGNTALHVAAMCGHTEVLQELLKNGAAVDAPNPFNSQTALAYAAAMGHAKAVNVLLGHGADANALDDEGCSPLHRAVGGFSLECVELLLKHGADPNRRDKYGLSVLEHALIGPAGRAPLDVRYRIVEALLRHGADKDATTNQYERPGDSFVGLGRQVVALPNPGETAEQLARRLGYEKIAELFANWAKRKRTRG